MAELTATTDRRPSLLVVALATFDTVAFVLLLVLGGHATGVLSDLLAGLNTTVGVAVFLYLWALVVLGLEWALSLVSLDESPTKTLASRAVGAGGLVGATFLLGILLVALVPLVFTGDVSALTLVLFLVFGTAVAVVVGAVVGLLFGLLDLGLYRLAGRLLPTRATDPDRL